MPGWIRWHHNNHRDDKCWVPERVRPPEPRERHIDALLAILLQTLTGRRRCSRNGGHHSPEIVHEISGHGTSDHAEPEEWPREQERHSQSNERADETCDND